MFGSAYVSEEKCHNGLQGLIRLITSIRPQEDPGNRPAIGLRSLSQLRSRPTNSHRLGRDVVLYITLTKL
jgi:hypothetical protein